MYVHHFDFREPPFSIAPDPQFLFLSPQHREGLAHLLYGIGAGGGFVVLTGEVGTGKTMLCRCLLEQLPADVDLALIFNPRLNPEELLASICDELRIPREEHAGSLKDLIDRLNHHLLETHARGRRAIVLIDEAQNLRFDVLEQIRLLTNLETNRDKLLQFILVGQPELNEVLSQPELRQLAQRITARFHLRPLKKTETREYITHRLSIAGVRQSLFSTWAIRTIHRRTGGIPRLINRLCDRSLLGAYTLNKAVVDYGVVRKAAWELGAPQSEPGRAWLKAGGAVLGLTLAAGLAFAAYRWMPEISGLWESWPERWTEWSAELWTPAAPETAAKNPPAEEKSYTAEGGQPSAPVPAAETSAVAATPANSETNPTPAAPEDSVASRFAMDFATTIAEPGLTRESAMAQLMEMWKLPPPESGTDACVAAERDGLRCLSNRSEWFQLTSLNHPAVLELIARDGGKRYAVLAGISGQTVALILAGRPQTFELVEILPFWRGTWTLLWRPPGGDTRTLVPGDRREGVRWLRQHLGGKSQTGEDDYFDNDLRARVFAFQIQRGLPPDGMAGPNTLLHLEGAINTGPRLVSVSP